MQIASVHQQDVKFMKLLDKYNFDWNLLSNEKETIFLRLCAAGNVDCLKFFVRHYNSIDIAKMDSLQTFQRQDCQDIIRMISPEFEEAGKVK